MGKSLRWVISQMCGKHGTDEDMPEKGNCGYMKKIIEVKRDGNDTGCIKESN